jgi:hypothetical protein
MTTKTIRDLCGSCRKLMDPHAMRTFEGDRYCPECDTAIREDRAAFYQISKGDTK